VRGARRTSVLLLTPSAQAGGAERAFVSLASLLPEHGFDPQIVLCEQGPLEQWLDHAGCSYTVAPAEIGGSVETAVSWLAREASRVGAAAVVSNKSQGHIVGGQVATDLDLPAVWWQQDIASKVKYELAAAAIPVSVIVCSSDYAVEAQRALTPGADVRKIHLGIPVAVVASRGGAGAEARQAVGCNGNPLVGIVGRLEAWKGQDVFLRAAARVGAEHPRAVFAVVGGRTPGKEDEYPSRLQAMVRELQLGGRVHFAGHAVDVFPWFDALDVCVHATHGEPFGLVLVEAMALGKPLVATALGGPVEIVEEGVSGLLVPPGDDEALAGAICRLLADDALAARLAEGGRRRAFEFTDERMAAAFADVLREVVAA
jgi:glycosyltransferase involved in cell wall biosynthesis